MRSEVVIVGERIEELVAVAASLSLNAKTVTVAQTKDVLARAKVVATTTSSRLVLFLTERDKLADLREILSSAAAVVFLVAPTSPPHAPLAKLAAEFGAGLCGRDDPPVVREALLVALAAQWPEQEVS